MFPHTPFVGLAAEQLVPTELLVIEFYVSDAEFEAGLHPTPRVYDLLHSERGFPGTAIDIGRVAAGLEHYTPGAKRPLVEEVRAYATILDTFERKLPSGLDRMHLFRWRVPYPIVDTNYALCADATSH